MKKLAKRLGIGLGVLVVIAVAAGLVAERWIIPGIIASHLQSAIVDRWDGEVTVGNVEFSYSGPIIVHDVEIRDHAKRPWLHIGSAELTLRNWPGTSPVLTAIDIRQVSVGTHFVQGRLDAPFRTPPPQSSASPPTDLSKYVDIQQVTVRDISYTMTDGQSHEATWEFQQLAAVKQASGIYKVSLTSPTAATNGPAGDGAAASSPASASTFTLGGSINPDTFDAHLALDGDLPADASRMAALLSSLNMPFIKGVDGRLHADDVRLEGRLNEPSSWRLVGQIDFQGFGFDGPYGVLAKDVDCELALDGRTIHVKRFSANACGGNVAVDGEAEIEPDWSITYRATVNATKVDVPALTASIAGPDKKAQRGTLVLKAKFYDAGGGIRGSALLDLDDTDLMKSSIFAELFSQMGLGGDQLHKSDVQSVLVFNGPLITVRHGRLANALSAMDVEKGGTINVQTRQLDLHVTGVPLKAIDGILKLPVIGILSQPFRNLRDKLIRLQIKGDWRSPPGDIIKKEALQDVSQGTVDFFSDVAKSGGEMGDGAVKTVTDIFRALGGG